MPRGRTWIATACAAALLVAVPATRRSDAGESHELGVGFALGPGWATPPGDPAARTGGAGAVVMGWSLTPSLAVVVDARFWWHTEDTLRTELTLAGPGIQWQPWGRGPLLRAMAGAGYVHRISELAASSVDQRDDGAGGGLSLGWEWRPWRTVGLTPELDAGWIRLDHGRSSRFTSATLALTWYMPLR